MTVKIYNHESANSVTIFLPQCFVDTLKVKQVVVTEIDKEIRIREAIIDDVRTIKVQADNHINCGMRGDKSEIIGEYEYEIDGDYLVLYRA